MTEIFKTPRSFGLVAISLLVDLDHLNHLCSTTQTSPTMPEISVEERRRRRQEKIRAGAADRLAKITEGNKGREGEKPTLSAASPSPAAQDSPYVMPLNEIGSKPSSAMPQATQDFFSGPFSSQAQSLVNASQPPNGGNPGGQGSSNEEDPLFKLLSQLNSMGSEDAPAEDFNAFASQFASMMGMPNGAGVGPDGAASPGAGIPSPTFTTTVSTPKSRKADFFWILIHLVVFTFLALSSGFTFSQLSKFPPEHSLGDIDGNSEPIVQITTYSASKLLLYFSTFELILQSTRFFLENGAPPADSTIAKFANYIPHPFNEYLYTGARYIKMVRTIVQDFCWLLFIGGLYSVFSN